MGLNLYTLREEIFANELIAELKIANRRLEKSSIAEYNKI